MHDPEIKEII